MVEVCDLLLLTLAVPGLTTVSLLIYRLGVIVVPGRFGYIFVPGLENNLLLDLLIYLVPGRVIYLVPGLVVP